MSNARLKESKMESGNALVFFQSAADPTHTSYLTFDPGTKTWSDVSTVSKITLPGPFLDGSYLSGPRAAFYKNDLYLFATGETQIEPWVTRLRNGEWSDAVPIAIATGDGVTPYVLNGDLYIFYRDVSNFCISCLKVDENFSTSGPWVSNHCGVQFTIAVTEGGGLFYNNNGALERMSFDSQNKEFGSPEPSGCYLNLGPSVASYSILEIPFYKGLETDTRLFTQGVVVDGVHVYTAPAAVPVAEASEFVDFAVFYAGADDPHNLKVSIIRSGNNTVTVLDTSDSGYAVGPKNCCPFAIMVP